MSISELTPYKVRDVLPVHIEPAPASRQNLPCGEAQTQYAMQTPRGCTTADWRRNLNFSGPTIQFAPTTNAGVVRDVEVAPQVLGMGGNGGSGGGSGPKRKAASVKSISGSEDLAAVMQGKNTMPVANVLAIEAPAGLSATSSDAEIISYLFSLTQSREGELQIFQTAATLSKDSSAWQKRVVAVWFEAVTNPQASGTSANLRNAPLVQNLIALPEEELLIARADNFKLRKEAPWCGDLIRPMMTSIGVPAARNADDDIGEAWVHSGYRTFPSRVVVTYGGHLVNVPIWLIGKLNPVALYGAENVARFGDELPTITKILNSGSWIGYRAQLKTLFEQLGLDAADLDYLDPTKYNNHELYLYSLGFKARFAKAESPETQALVDQVEAIFQKMIECSLSVQSHPDAAKAKACGGDAASKHEAWYIRDAEPGAGIYLGLAPGASEEEMRRRLENGQDIMDLLKFVPVKAGDTYDIEPGTIHAIGAGISLWEPQQKSATTRRIYDFNRVDKNGEKRELHVDLAMSEINWNTARGSDFIEAARRRPIAIDAGNDGRAQHEILLVERDYSFDRVSFAAGDSFTSDATNGNHDITVSTGFVDLYDRDGSHVGRFGAGQPITIPAAMGEYKLVASVAAEVFITRTDPRKITLGQLMENRGVKFGTSGLRAHEAKLTDEVVTIMAEVYALHLEQKYQYAPGQTIVVGSDYRPSAPRVLAALAKTLEAKGYKVINGGNVPTQTLAFYAKKHGHACAMVTASHNPEDEQGIKFYGPNGEEFLKADEPEMKAIEIQVPLAAAGNSSQRDGGQQQDQSVYEVPAVNPDVIAAYKQHYINHFGRGSFAGLKVGVWKYRSVGPSPMIAVLRELGADVQVIVKDSATQFISVDTEAVPEDIREFLTGKRDELGLDFVLAFDPDADRPLLTTYDNEVMVGGKLGMIAALLRGTKTVVVPYTLTSALEATGWFDEVVRTDVGSPYCVEKLQQFAAQGVTADAWENNGGYLASDLRTRDSFLPMLLVLQAKLKQPDELAGMLDTLRNYTYSSSKVEPFPPEHTRALVRKFVDHPEIAQEQLSQFGKISQIEEFHNPSSPAAIIRFESGAVLILRPSGNAAELKFYAMCVAKDNSVEARQAADQLTAELVAWTKINGPVLGRQYFLTS